MRKKLKSNNIKYVEYSHSATKAILLSYEMISNIHIDESQLNLVFKDQQCHLIQLKLLSQNSFSEVAKHFVKMLTWLIDFSQH